MIVTVPLSRLTGISTTPAVVKDVLAVIVRVGAVASPSEATVIPVGLVIVVGFTDAGICCAPRIAMIWVVQVPAFAAFTVPGNVYPSDVRITEYASVTSIILI